MIGSILSIEIGVDILPALGYLFVALGVALFILNIRLALRRRSLISFIGGALIAAGLTVGGDGLAAGEEVWTLGVAPPKTSPFPFVLPSDPFWHVPLEIETYDLIFGIALYFRDLGRALKKRFQAFFRRSS